MAFADDISGKGKLLHLKQRWRDLVKHGYYPKGGKIWITVNTFLLEAATRIFPKK